MLDIQTYRMSEQLARAHLPSWRVSQVHNLDQFERVGFPVRVNNLRELAQLLDTMQENRFDAYMQELGGLSKEEEGMLYRISHDILCFQRIYFPKRNPVLPLSTLMSVITLYKKMKGIKPNFESVLEIGPGCGYLSLILKYHESLKDYSQIEACESFYLFQNLINLHSFAEKFDENVLLPKSSFTHNFFSKTTSEVVENIKPVLLKEIQPIASHYPWWKLGELLSNEKRYEIVTSNANLLEFSAEALSDYLDLISQVMKPTGVFLVQCLGYPANGNTESVLDVLWGKGFAPLTYMLDRIPSKFPGSAEEVTIGSINAEFHSVEVEFTVHNAMFIKEGHPLYVKYRNRSNCHNKFIAPEKIVNSVFFERPVRRRIIDRREIVENIESNSFDINQI